MPNLINRKDGPYPGRRPAAPRMVGRRPFWLPGSNYYVFSVSLSVAFFFVMWGVLHDGGEETPWITAGVSASMLLCGAVILREVILRRARNNFLRQQKRMDTSVFDAYSRLGENRNHHKLTLEKNAVILREIRQKSEAAQVLSKFSAGHREVFEICVDYLELNEGELKTVNPGSSRLAALLKGRASAVEYHRYHMLKWAEIESRSLTNDANSLVNTEKKIEAAQNALNVIEVALASYPSETSLLDSRELLGEMVVSIKVSHWVERAERAAFKGDYAKARSLYRDALFYLGRDNVQNDERERAALMINAEIEKIRTLEAGDH